MQPTRAAFIVIKRRHRHHGKLQFLVMKSTQLVATERREVGHEMLKFPSGGENFPGELPAAIAYREVGEETGLTYTRAIHVWKEAIEDHERYGYIVDFADCSGEMRTSEEMDGRKELLGPPFWMDAAGLDKRICDGHKELCEVACRYLAYE